MKKIMIIISCFFLVACTKTQTPYLENYKETTKEEYNMQYKLDDEDNVFISISYDLFIEKMNNKDTFIFYFGGTWCQNSRAVAPLINEVLKENNLVTYNFDPRNGENTSDDDLRNIKTEEHYLLYKTFIDTLGYESDDKVNYYNKLSEIVDTVSRLSVPAMFAIKEGVINYTLIEEYSETEITEEEKTYYKNEIKNLINNL